METTFDVKIWAILIRKRANGRKSYRARWRVASKPWSKSFATRALAESFRSQLIAAQNRGEAFRIADGLPVSMSRELNDQSWFEFAQRYADMKWPRAAAKSRAGNADALASATFALLSSDRGRPANAVLRRAMTGWAFNRKRREAEKPADIERALKWLASNTMPVSRLDDPATLRLVLDQLAVKMDGKPAAAKTFSRKRAVIYNAVEYGVEQNLVTENRLSKVKWTAPRHARAIDTRVVINPRQARELLASVNAQQVPGQLRRSSGPMLVAFFAAMYYSALRPEEAAMLSKPDLVLPKDGWGKLLLSQAAPIAGGAWTNSGERRDRRQLKQRGVGEVRQVPCPPPLTSLLHQHLDRHGTAADGRLFRNLTGGDLAESTIARVWDRARKAALSEAEYTSVLARRPYDLRHACVSTWLAAGVPSTQIAEWAGHSVAVLHQIYAKVIAGQESTALARIGDALGLGDATAGDTYGSQNAGDDRTDPGNAG